MLQQIDSSVICGIVVTRQNFQMLGLHVVQGWNWGDPKTDPNFDTRRPTRETWYPAGKSMRTLELWMGTSTIYGMFSVAMFDSERIPPTGDPSTELCSVAVIDPGEVCSAANRHEPSGGSSSSSSLSQGSGRLRSRVMSGVYFRFWMVLICFGYVNHWELGDVRMCQKIEAIFV